MDLECSQCCYSISYNVTINILYRWLNNLPCKANLDTKLKLLRSISDSLKTRYRYLTLGRCDSLVQHYRTLLSIKNDSSRPRNLIVS